MPVVYRASAPDAVAGPVRTRWQRWRAWWRRLFLRMPIVSTDRYRLWVQDGDVSVCWNRTEYATVRAWLLQQSTDTDMILRRVDTDGIPENPVLIPACWVPYVVARVCYFIDLEDRAASLDRQLASMAADRSRGDE